MEWKRSGKPFSMKREDLNDTSLTVAEMLIQVLEDIRKDIRKKCGCSECGEEKEMVK